MQRPHQRSRESAASFIALLSRDGYQPLEKVGKPDCDVASVMLQPRLTADGPAHRELLSRFRGADHGEEPLERSG